MPRGAWASQGRVYSSGWAMGRAPCVLCGAWRQPRAWAIGAAFLYGAPVRIGTAYNTIHCVPARGARRLSLFYHKRPHSRSTRKRKLAPFAAHRNRRGTSAEAMAIAPRTEDTYTTYAHRQQATGNRHTGTGT
eukprot:scaffold2931_cov154-Isochrysis_galbana.AAC.7